MGRNQSKVAIAPHEGPIVDDMRKKYGPNCLDMLDVWVEKEVPRRGIAEYG